MCGGPCLLFLTPLRCAIAVDPNLSQTLICDKRQDVQKYLLHHITHVPFSTGIPPGTFNRNPSAASQPSTPDFGDPRHAAFRLLRTAGLSPTVGLLDLVRLPVEPSLLLQLNPFLSGESQAHIEAAVSLWLQLSVLEDRLGRLQLMAQAGEEAKPMLLQVRGSHHGLDAE